MVQINIVVGSQLLLSRYSVPAARLLVKRGTEVWQT
jgi:hypothetical protein